MSMVRRIATLLALALWALQALPATAQTRAEAPMDPEALVEAMSALAGEPRLLLFRSAPFDPTQGVPPEASFALTEARDRDSGSLCFVVQFPCVPGDSERKLLSELGAEILHYIPNNAYLVRVDASAFPSLESDDLVRSAFRLPKFVKVDPDLSSDLAVDRTVELVAVPGTDATPAAGLLAKRFPGLRFVTDAYHHKGGRIICEVPSSDLYEFIDLASGIEDVLSILPWQEKILLNDNSIWVGQNYDTTNKLNYALSATVWNHGITGTGQIVCVNDSGCDTDMCYFRYDGTAGSKTTSQSLTPPDTGNIEAGKKIIAYYVQPGAIDYDYSGSSFHGTHVSGSVLGDNYATLSTPTSGGHDSGDGMAPNAKLVLQDVGGASGLSGLVGDLDLMFLQAYNAGARIHSDSWGTDQSNYDSTAMDMDEFTYRHEDFLFVVAMGNSGTAPGDGSIGSPATAKNVVSVGATTNGSSSNANNLQPYSRGPVDDGRRKPDVCTPGASINSASGTTSNTDNNCSPKTLSGTSMATPTTSGFLALLRQYFADGWYPTGTKTAGDARNPSAALMKACIINGAMEMTGTDLVNSSTVSRIPSMDQGWGRTHLENALYFSGDSRRTRLWDVRRADGLATGQQAEYAVTVTSNSQPLKVHLVWSDPESTTLASVNLVNNLDLEVVAPGGTVYKGNVFATGQSTAGGTADILNPVEGFVLNSPATGTWTLRVKATAVPGAGTAPYSNRQGYALVATWANCASTVTAPTGLSATDNGATGIDLSWNTVAGATGYVVYKAIGASPAPGDFSVLVQQAGTTFTDTKVQGGYTYWYKVRATDDCSESSPSSAASATYGGNCTLYPAFSGIGSVANDLGTVVCDLVLSWPAATSNCPLGPAVTYNIYRGTTPYFTPDGTSLLAHGVPGTTYTDYSVAGLATYYYLVRAEDGTSLNGGPHNGGNQDTNTKMLKGTPWASSTVSGTFSDDGGDTNAKLITNGVWRVSNRQNHTSGGSLCYYNALDGNTYQAGQCADLRTPALPLQAGAQLSYWVRYNIEYQWDGVVVEISTNDGGSWTALTPTGGYPSTFSQTGTPPVNACAYASTQACFNGPSTNAGLTAWTQYTHDLSAYAGLTVIVRWNFSSDGGAEFEGFYLDDIAITNASVNEGCATRDGIVALDSTSYNCAGDTIGIQLADYDLRGNGTQAVTIASTGEPGGEIVTLTESPPGSGSFSGTIATTASAPPSAGQLSVADGDTITVTYIDADDGHGGTSVTKTDTATADCVAPVISNVQAIHVTFNAADITWDTNEPADSFVQYDTATPPVAWNASSPAMVTPHSIHLSGLAPCTTYRFYVRSTDPASNQATDTNGGAYYSFETPQLSQPTYDSTDVPKTIADSSTVTSALVVADSKVIQDVNVTIGNIAHTYDGDLEVRLIAPDATVVLLVDNRGGTGENFVGTVFDDEAAASITSGAAPFTGSFRPEGTLSALDGKNAAGTWILSVTDTAGGDTGTLNAWSLTFTYPPQACGPSLEYQASAYTDECSGGGSGDGDTFIDPGEDVALQLTLHNNGTSGTTGVRATISTATPGITVTDDSATFPNIAADGTGASQANHFAFTVGTGVTCGTVITFNLHMVSNEKPAGWDDTFTLTVGHTTAGTPTEVFAESFDGATFPPAGWTETDVSGTAGDWSRMTTSVHPTGISPRSGAAMAGFNSYTSSSGSSTRLARTAAISVPAGSTAASAALWVYHESGYTALDNIQVQTSPDGTTWTTRGTVNRYDGSTGWKLHTVDLSALIGAGDFRIGYLGVSAYGNDCHLDDVSVTYTPPGACIVAACTPVLQPPGETSPGDSLADSLHWTDGATQAWSANGQATGYRVVRGGPVQLPFLLTGDADSCTRWTGGGTAFSASEVPSSGSFYWYLVVGTNAAGDGHPGYATQGARTLDPSGTCP